MNKATTVKLNELDVPEIRKDPTDVEYLARSMGHHGQREPIVLYDNIVVSGTRRVAAARKLGWTVIDAVRIGSLTEAADVMAAEGNDARKPLRPTEKARISLTLRDLPLGIPDAEVARLAGPATAFQTIAGRALGVSAPMVRQVILAWELSVDPSAPRDHRFAALDALKRMDATGGVDPAFRALSAQIGGFRSRRRPRNVGISERQARAPRHQSPGTQEVALRRLVTQAQNLVTAIDWIGEVKPGIDPTEAKQTETDLYNVRNRITKLINQLRRISNDNSSE